MICYVDIEHARVLADPEKRASHLANRMEIKLRLEEISGEACLVQHYTRVTRQRLAEWRVKALLISGCGTPWSEYDETGLSEMYAIVRSGSLPILGFCGGCQLIALAHGVPVDSMRPLREGEVDARPGYRPGMLKEWGFMPVQILRSDPLFYGLGEQPLFWQAHAEELKGKPSGFELLASSEACPVQAIKQRDRPVYGTQFHPEWYADENPDGRRLLGNFFRVIGLV